MTRFLCAEKVDKKFCRQEGKSNSRRLTPGSSSQQFEDSRARKEGYSRQIQGLKQFQDSADRTRKKTQGGIQGSQRPLQEGQIQAVHSDQTIEGGRIQAHHNLPTITPHLAED